MTIKLFSHAERRINLSDGCFRHGFQFATVLRSANFNRTTINLCDSVRNELSRNITFSLESLIVKTHDKRKKT
jgi:hypothetical protein